MGVRADSRHQEPVSDSQFATWADRGLPEVELVASGVWDIPVPLPDAVRMGFVHTYLIASEGVAAMVDPGWDSPVGLDTLARRMGEIAPSLGDVSAVLVTHIHPDHVGAALTIQEQTGARVLMGEADLPVFGPSRSTDATVLCDVVSFLAESGAPFAIINELTAERDLIDSFGTFRGLRAKDMPSEISIGSIRVEGIATPGHTPGHTSFHLPDARLLMTGDHVLPHVTPNIAAYDYETNPLKQYLDSLHLTAEFDVEQVLPGHEFRFTNLRQRVRELLEHHEERGSQVIEILGEMTEATSWQIAERLSWFRNWAVMDGFTRRSANGETAAHLLFLHNEGRVERRTHQVLGRAWTWSTA